MKGFRDFVLRGNLIELAVAFIVTPYLALRLVRAHPPGHAPRAPGRFARRYEEGLRRLLARRRERFVFYGAVLILLLGSIGLVLGKVVVLGASTVDSTAPRRWPKR